MKKKICIVAAAVAALSALLLSGLRLKRKAG